PRGIRNWLNGPPPVPTRGSLQTHLRDEQSSDAEEEDSQRLREMWARQPAPEDMHNAVARFLATPGDRPAASRKRDLLTTMTSGSSDLWQQVGQGIYVPDDPAGGHPRAGRIHAAAYAFDNSQNATPLWLGASGGGLWKAVNLGLFAIWQPVSDNLP